MLPFRHSSIFKSRWIALLWAGGIIWWAASTVGTQNAPGNNDSQAAQTDALGQPVDEQQVKRLEDQLRNLGK
ncbi:hypothetical protein [Flavisphingomonas formosensis]|uniref:hypothetical protein n=1 Tax=Flavisphingomonas formosensis TaxID=861534 RepID=UPI0012F84E68|nr:hypothetical protein [Sphingomonas formosensis]